MKGSPIGLEIKRKYHSGTAAWVQAYESTEPPTIYLNADYRYRNEAEYQDRVSSTIVHETLHLVITRLLGGVKNEETEVANQWLDSQVPHDLSGDFSSLDDFVHVEIPASARIPAPPLWVKYATVGIIGFLLCAAIDWYFTNHAWAATVGGLEPFTPVAAVLAQIEKRKRK